MTQKSRMFVLATVLLLWGSAATADSLYGAIQYRYASGPPWQLISAVDSEKLDTAYVSHAPRGRPEVVEEVICLRTLDLQDGSEVVRLYRWTELDGPVFFQLTLDSDGTNYANEVQVLLNLQDPCSFDIGLGGEITIMRGNLRID